MSGFVFLNIYTPKQQQQLPSSDRTSYISLYDHPGVGQTHVALCAEELQALLQIPLGVMINLRKQDRENGCIRKDDKII